MDHMVVHTGVFEYQGLDLSFTRWERQESLAYHSWMTAGFDSNAENARVPLILLHGFAQSSETWGEIASVLADSQGIGAVYALDLVGHGASDKPKDAQLYEMPVVCDSVRDFCAWVAHREGEVPALVGYSMGGRIALECLSSFGWKPSLVPSRGLRRASTLPISALILESAGLGPLDEAAREAFHQRNTEWAKKLREQGVSAFMDYWENLSLFETQRELPQAKRDALRSARESNDAEALARTFEGTGQHHQHSELETISALNAAIKSGLQVTYICGGRDPKYAAVAEKIGRACPGVNVSEVPAVGHSVHLENPEAFVRACLRA